MKTDKRFISLVLFAVLFAVAVSFGGGCGGSSDSSEENRSVQVIGELHGKYAEEFKAQSEIETVTDLSEASKVENQPIIVSKEQGLSLSDEETGLLKERLMAGQAVCIEHVWGDEINYFLSKLGIKMEDNYVHEVLYQYYGLKNIDGNIFAFLAVEPEQPSYPDVPGVPEDSDPGYSEEDAKGIGKFAPFRARGIEEQKDILSDIPEPLTDTLGSPEYTQKKSRIDIAATALDWMYSNEQAQMCSEHEKKRREAEVSAAFRREKGLRGEGDSKYNLANMDSIYQKKYKLDFLSDRYLLGSIYVPQNISKEITIEITTCHVYKETGEGEDENGSESDWFFVKQYCEFDAGPLYAQNEKDFDGGKEPFIKGYIHDYKFRNYPLGAGNEYVFLQESSPNPPADRSRTVSSEMSVGFGAGLGILGGDLSNLEASLGYACSEEFSIDDVTVEKFTAADDMPACIKWRYSFPDPKSDGPCFWGRPRVHMPVKLAMGSFSPVNQWAWEVPDKCRDDVKSFRMEFDLTVRYWWSPWYDFWIRDKKMNSGASDMPFHWEETVPFCKYAPVIVANKIKTVPSEKTTVSPEVKCFRDWSAESDSDWCRIYKKNQNPPAPGDTEAEKKYGKYIEGSKDDLEDDCIYIDVVKNKGVTRTAKITYKTKDGRGSHVQSITQSGVIDYTSGIECEDGIIDVDPVPAGTVPLKFNCNKDWTAESDKDWCLIIDRTVDGDEGSQFVSGTADTKDNFVILVLENTTDKNRSATITLKTADGSSQDTLVISQTKKRQLK